MKQRILTLLVAVVMAFAVSAQVPTTEQATVKVTHLTKAEFLAKVMNYEKNPTEWIYLGDKPCLIDFYASWCGPCKRLAPVLDELAQEYAGEIYIYKIDTEKERELAAVFGVRSIPTLLFCPMGENPQIAQGALPKEQLKEAIDKVLLKK
ncbi:MAG: thioredoxin [Paludibacteraceae bacterium]|nr:thioredoxin [Paludibacteraceae bacterium]